MIYCTLNYLQFKNKNSSIKLLIMHKMRYAFRAFYLLEVLNIFFGVLYSLNVYI